MVSPVQYLRTHIGIDISKPASEQSVEAVEVANRDTQPRRIGERKMSKSEAIYDAVVGIDHVDNCDFDPISRQARRLNAFELGTLASHSRALREKGRDHPMAMLALLEIEDAAKTYQKLLEGKLQHVRKDMDFFGSRHTLVRGVNGTVFEMTNSMNDAEVARFRRKTGMQVAAVDRPVRSRIVNGEAMHKIELGSGGFGKARIARDIISDTYVAVKKVHPSVELDANNHLMASLIDVSNFSHLNQRIDFAQISDAVVVPVDECIVESKRAMQFNHLTENLNRLKCRHEPGPLDVLSDLPRMRALRKKLGDYAYAEIIATMCDEALPDLPANGRSNYSFSELGIMSVGGFLERFNVIRFHLERSVSGIGMSFGANTLLANHAALLDTGDVDGLSDMQLARRRARLAADHFAQSDFHLKDPIYNQRFLNSLGRDMLIGLAKLHDALKTPMSHRDVKPDNIVLCQETGGKVVAKLIDLDLMEECSKARELPGAGCETFMPPEAFLPEHDGSIAYDAQKADAYAMGASLRLVVGFGIREVDEISRLLQLDATATLLAKKSLRSQPRAAARLQLLRHELADAKLRDDNRVQNQLRVQAIMNTVPEAVTLKDLADLMLKDHPGKRFLPLDILRLPFFENAGNFLSCEEFSAHVKNAVRFMQVIDKEEVNRINDLRPGTSENLKQVRRVAARAALLRRGHTPVAGEILTLSRGEAKKVDCAERILQSRELLWRGVRSFIGIGNNGASIATRKLRYVRSFAPH